MMFHAEHTGRSPQFRVAYRKLPCTVRLLQHRLRCDLRFASDDSAPLVWTIWPEFEREPGVPYLSGELAPDVGTATMWVVNDEASYRDMLRERVHAGATGWFVGGSLRIAEFIVVELLEAL